MEKTGRDRLAIRRYSVLAYKGAPIMVTRVGEDGSTSDKSTVYFDRIGPDGSLLNGGHINGFEVDTLFGEGILHYIDHASVDIRVKLPSDWQERNEALARERAESETAARERRRDDETAPEEHPSYATVSLYRSQGGTGRLFGSPFQHMNSVHIEIRRATRHRSLSNDRVHPGGPLIAQIALSEAQFAHFVTSMAVGEGTPCTLEYVGGEAMPEPPPEKETEKFHADAQRALARAAKDIREAIDKATALLDKPSVSKKDRQEIVSLLSFALRAHEEHLPFTIEQFNARMEKIVSAGKHEIEAFLQNTVNRLGLEAVKAQPIAFLTEGEEKK